MKLPRTKTKPPVMDVQAMSCDQLIKYIGHLKAMIHALQEAARKNA